MSAIKEDLIEKYGNLGSAIHAQSDYLYNHGLFDACSVINVLDKDREYLLESLKVMSALCKIKYGNLDSDVWEEIQKADELINRMTKYVQN